MKRNYLFFWFAVLLLLFSPARSYAEVYSGTCGENVNWTLDTETGLLEITGSGEMEDYGYFSGGPWYNCRTNIKECVIENSVTSIGEYAFYKCTGLTSFTIPESVTSIGVRAFEGCTGLTSINVDKNNPNYCSQNGVLFTKDMKSINCVPAGKTGDYSIPNSVTSIGEYAFSGCTGLTSITIPNSVTSIGEYAFYNFTGLTNITIPNSVTSIESYAFYGCTGLTSITIPNSVTSIESYAFCDCN